MRNLGLNIPTGNYGGVRFLYASPSEIYIYGGLYKTDAPTFNKYQVAYWNGINWNFLGELNGSIYPNTLVMDENYVYATGDFVENGMYPIKKYPRQINLVKTEFTIDEKTKIFPNPSNNFITIQNKENVTEKIDYKILDLTGRVIKSAQSKFNEQINIESLTSGNYIIQVETERGEKITKKLIKN